MATDWPRMTIAECAAPEPYSTQIGPFGKALMADEYVDIGIPVLRGVNVNQGRFHDDDFVFIDNETANRLAKFESFPGDILLVHKGTLGEIGLMPTKRRYPHYIMGNSMMRVRCDPKKLLPEFLYYWLTSADGQHYLFSRVSQVGVPQIQTPLTTLRQAELPVPPIPEQRAIASILGSLDDKIELNRKTCETLEEMARAIFKSWFVDFDPVRAKMAGEKPEAICTRLGLTREMLELFPDRLVDSELGEIPEGWEVKPFSETVEIIGGGTPKTSMLEYWSGDIPWFSVADTPSFAEVWVVDTEKKVTQKGIEASSTKMMSVGTTIISARGTVGKLALVGVPMTMNQSCYGLRGKQGAKGFFNYFSTRMLVSILQQRAHGSVFDTITRGTFSGVSAVVPLEGVVDEFERIAEPLLYDIHKNLLQSRSLAAVRDALLPKLISGEIEVG